MADTVVLLHRAPPRRGRRTRAPRSVRARRGWRTHWATVTLALGARGVLTAMAVLLVWSVAPALLGWHSTVVMTGSMEPRLAVGDVAIARPVAPADLRIGQILLVDDPDHPGRLRLHRLVDVQDGRLVLKGDANPTADSGLVDPASVRGVGVLRVPTIALPVARWAVHDRTAAVLAAGGVVALALLAVSGDPVGRTLRPARPPFPYSRPARRAATAPRLRPGRWRRPLAVFAIVCGCVATAHVVVPAWASYASTTTSRLSLASNIYYTCVNAAYDGSPSAPGPARTVRYFPLQESDTTGAAVDNGSQNAAPGTYADAPTPSSTGAVGCGAGGTRSVTFDGVSQLVSTTTPVPALTDTTVALGFTTTSTSGGLMFGLADHAGTGASTRVDRVLYMTATGRIGFGVMDGTTPVGVLSPGAYNNGVWHLVNGVLSSSGMTLYVDGYPVATLATTTSTTAGSGTGYPRIGSDSLAGYPGAPVNSSFAGSIAHVGLNDVALSQATILAQVYSAS